MLGIFVHISGCLWKACHMLVTTWTIAEESLATAAKAMASNAAILVRVALGQHMSTQLQCPFWLTHRAQRVHKEQRKVIWAMVCFARTHTQCMVYFSVLTPELGTKRGGSAWPNYRFVKIHDLETMNPSAALKGELCDQSEIKKWKTR